MKVGDIKLILKMLPDDTDINFSSVRVFEKIYRLSYDIAEKCICFSPSGKNSSKEELTDKNIRAVLMELTKDK